MNEELHLTAKFLQEAASPEDIFGQLTGNSQEMLAQAKKTYRRLARVVHPDRNRNCDGKEAEDAYKRLEANWQEAKLKIASNTYGVKAASRKASPVIIQSSTTEYTVGDLAFKGDYANLYICSFTNSAGTNEALFKVARSPRDNDLIQNEEKALTHLAESSQSNPHPFIPRLIESFGYKEAGTKVNRWVNILSFREGLFSLSEVRKHYVDGVDPKHMAWIFRRLLMTLGYSHQSGVLHGAVTPSHILVHPGTHDIQLTDWSYSLVDPHLTGAVLAAIDSSYEEWYPEEVKKKEQPMKGLDLYMAASSMMYVMGGDPVTGYLPDSVPRQLRAFLRGCRLSALQRPQDAWKLSEEFDEVIVKLWGKRTFIPFEMPARQY